MYKHILIPTDGSEVAGKGVSEGLSLAKTLGARVTVITVTEPFPFHASPAGIGWVPSQADIDAFEQGQKEFAATILASAKTAAGEAGVEAAVLHVPDAWPAEAIINAATAEGCSLIVMSSHGRRGIGRLLLGSQASEVLSRSPVPVLVVR